MKNLALSLLCASFLTACSVTSAGVKPGDERNLARSVHDVNAGRVIEARMRRAYDHNLKGVDVEVAEGVVLLSGNVHTKEARIEAERIAWSAPKVDQVGNEIMIREKQTFSRNAKDGLLEKSVRTRLTAAKSVKARNFNVETHEGIVYLLGVARTPQELEKAAQIAAHTKGTTEVISYVRVANKGPQQAMSTPNANPLAAQPINPYATQQPTQRALPDFLSTTPPPGTPLSGSMGSNPMETAPLGEPIPFHDQATGPTAPQQLDMRGRVNKEFPSDEELGAYRMGQAGETISEMQSAPYYVDPVTGKEIPVTYLPSGYAGPR